MMRPRWLSLLLLPALGSSAAPADAAAWRRHAGAARATLEQRLADEARGVAP